MYADLYLDKVDVEKYCSKCTERCNGECKYLRVNVIPQIPIVETAIPVDTGLFEIGKPSKNSPVIVTGNFLHTHTLIGEILLGLGIDCYLLSIDTDGYPVDMAVISGRFGGERILEAIEKSKLEERINHRRLVTPGLVDVEVRGWKVIRGPISALELPLFLTFSYG